MSANRYAPAQSQLAGAIGGWHGAQPIDTEGATSPFIRDIATDASGIAIAAWARGGTIQYFVWAPPDAALTVAPFRPESGENVLFDGATSDAKTMRSSIATYEWDFEDDGIFDAVGVNPIHVYPEAGDFTTRLRVTDDWGVAGETTIEVQVDKPAVPTATLTIIVQGAGVGHVNLDPNLNCTSAAGTCVFEVPLGTLPMFPFPAQGSVLGSVAGCDQPGDFDNSQFGEGCLLNITGDRTITVTFDLE